MAYRDVVLATVPVGYWRLGEPSGLVAMDEMYAFPGAYEGAPTLGAAGLIAVDTDTAMTGNGVNSRVALPVLPALPAWSIAFWIEQPVVSADFTGIFSTQGDLFDISTFANGHIGFFDGAWDQATVPMGTGIEFWVFTFDGTRLRIYKDGESVYNMASEGRAMLSEVAYIGSLGGAGFTAATIDEFAIWSRAITVSEVAAMFTAGTTGGAGLATVAQVKERLNINDATEDALIAGLIEQVSAWIEGYTKRWLTPRSGTYVVGTQAGYVLRVPKGIRSITSMGIATLAHQPPTGGTYTTLGATDYMLYPGELDRPTGWPATEIRLGRWTSYVYGTIENGATITGEFGWASVPLDIQAVCIDAVVTAYAVRKNGASGVIGAEDYALPPWAQFFSKGSPQRGTLDRYRHWEIG